MPESYIYIYIYNLHNQLCPSITEPVKISSPSALEMQMAKRLGRSSLTPILLIHMAAMSIQAIVASGYTQAIN
jgi:hypothetical protein